MRTVRVLRDRWASTRSDEGFTLIETSVATFLLGFVLLMTSLAMANFATSNTSGMSVVSADQRAMDIWNKMQSELVSADVLFDPSTEGSNAGTNPDQSAIPTGFSLRALTQTGGTPMCVQWRLLNTGVLQQRSFSNLWQTDGKVGSWANIASGINNPTTAPPFVLDTGSQFGGRLLDLNLYITGDRQTVNVQSSVTAHDAQFYQASSQDTQDCNPVPTP
jgi:hypothetical protein